jgi:hypothetical protein
VRGRNTTHKWLVPQHVVNTSHRGPCQWKVSSGQTAIATLSKFPRFTTWGPGLVVGGRASLVFRLGRGNDHGKGGRRIDGKMGVLGRLSSHCESKRVGKGGMKGHPLAGSLWSKHVRPLGQLLTTALGTEGRGGCMTLNLALACERCSS